MIKNTPLTNLNFMATENKTKEEVSTDFDLGEYMQKPKEGAEVKKPRVHDFSSSACIGCEG